MEYWEIDEITFYGFASGLKSLDAFLIIDDDGRLIVKVQAGGDNLMSSKKNQKSELPADEGIIDDAVPVSQGGRGGLTMARSGVGKR